MFLSNLNKKGQANNYFAGIITLFVSGFLLILAYLILSNFVTAFSGTSVWDSTLQSTADNFLWGLRVGDLIMVIIMVVLIIGVGITSYNVASAPVFFIITIIMSAFYGFVSYYFNYIFQAMVSSTLFDATLLYFSRTILICTNLHWVMLINIIVGSITFFGKRERGQFQ